MGGGSTKRYGDQVKFTTREGGSFSHVKGGTTSLLIVVSTQGLEVLAMLKGGGVQKFYPVLRVRRKKFQICNSPIL